MAFLYTKSRYISQRLDFTVNFCWMAYRLGRCTGKEVGPVFLNNLLNGKMTYLAHYKNGKVMAPTLSESGGTFLVRKLNVSGANKRVFVGDVVTIINPLKKNNILVRRVAATEGCEMISTDKTDEPFVLDKDRFWVLADNEKVKPEEAYDSRIFGPILMDHIVGRAIYCVRSASDHGIVQNSESGMQMDSPVLEYELNVDELIEKHKSGELEQEDD